MSALHLRLCSATNQLGKEICQNVTDPPAFIEIGIVH